MQHKNTSQTQVPSTMKASVYREFGGPEVLRYEDIPTPEPAEGEVLVKVLAVVIDYIQLHIRTVAAVASDLRRKRITVSKIRRTFPAAWRVSKWWGLDPIPKGSKLVHAI